MQFLCQRLQTCGDFGDFLNAVAGVLLGTGEQLNIVDHDHVQAALPLQPAGTGNQRGNRNTTGLVHMKGHGLHMLGGGGELFEIGFGNIATPDFR